MAQQRAGVEGNTGGRRKLLTIDGVRYEIIGKPRRTKDQIPGNDNRSTNSGGMVYRLREVRDLSRQPNKPYRTSPKPKPKSKKKLPDTR